MVGSPGEREPYNFYIYNQEGASNNWGCSGRSVLLWAIHNSILWESATHNHVVAFRCKIIYLNLNNPLPTCLAFCLQGDSQVCHTGHQCKPSPLFSCVFAHCSSTPDCLFYCWISSEFLCWGIRTMTTAGVEETRGNPTLPNKSTVKRQLLNKPRIKPSANQPSPRSEL